MQTTWRKSKMESGGGILLMNYIYDIYRLRHLTGLEVTRVYSGVRHIPHARGG